MSGDSNPGEGKEKPRASLFGRARDPAPAIAAPPARKEPKRKEPKGVQFRAAPVKRLTPHE